MATKSNDSAKKKNANKAKKVKKEMTGQPSLPTGDDESIHEETEKTQEDNASIADVVKKQVT